MDNINKIYERIESLYLEKGLTRKQFETELDLPQSFLSELKSGRTKVPSAKRLQKIAEYFKIRERYLLGDDEGKDFDEYVVGLDFRRLSDEIQKLPSGIKAITVNLIDSLYLLAYEEIRNQNIDLIETYYNIIRGLFHVKTNQKHLSSMFLSVSGTEDIINLYKKAEKDLIKNINKLLINSIDYEDFKKADSDQQEILSLWNKLDSTKQAEFKGELKGYIRAKEENKLGDEETVSVYRAASSSNNAEHQIVDVPKSDMDELRKAPKITRIEDL